MPLRIALLLPLALCAIGLLALVVESFNGNDPSRDFMWGLLVWVVALCASVGWAMRATGSST